MKKKLGKPFGAKTALIPARVVAEALGVHGQAVMFWRAGARKPQLKVRAEAGRLVGVPTADVPQGGRKFWEFLQENLKKEEKKS